MLLLDRFQNIFVSAYEAWPDRFPRHANLSGCNTKMNTVLRDLIFKLFDKTHRNHRSAYRRRPGA